MKKKNLNSPILDYAYQITNEDVETFLIIKNSDNSIGLMKDQHFYLTILGDRLIEKLEGRGYISMDEVKEKYPNIDIQPKKKVKWKRKRP